MNEYPTFKHTSLLSFLPLAFQSIRNAFAQTVKAMLDYQIALIETKQKHWPDISIVLPANITIKGVTFTKSKTQNGKRVYGNKDTRWHYRKSSFYIPFYHSMTLSKILCKWEQDSAVSLFLYLDSVFKNKHKLIHNQAPVMNRLCPFLLNLHK